MAEGSTPLASKLRRLARGYVIVSESHRDRYYIGFSSRLEDRLTEHNTGKNPSTAGLSPGVLPLSSASLQNSKRAVSNTILKVVQDELFSGVTFLVIWTRKDGSHRRSFFASCSEGKVKRQRSIVVLLHSENLGKANS
jgi:hypothetical protein